ncbi:MAG: pentapeptide repeat-containing protein [Synechococcales bacterium]|nr:pentapeptide repeat-containing protein [Synechococcales bacterium]
MAAMDATQLLNQYETGRRDFSGADLRGVNLAQAHLAQINLYRADLTGACLTGANLAEANLFKANLTQADLTRADLRGANLRRTDLTGTILLAANLDGAHFSEQTLPGGLPFLPLEVRQQLFDQGHDLSSLQKLSRLGAESSTAGDSHSTPGRSSRRSPQSLEKTFPHATPLPTPALLLLGAGYLCFGLLLSIHRAAGLSWVMTWLSSLGWLVEESLTWFSPVLGAIAIMLGTGLSLWAVIISGSLWMGLLFGLLMLGWNKASALRDSAWVAGIVTVLINGFIWVTSAEVGQSGPRLLSGFPSALLLVAGMAGVGLGAIAWLQMQSDGVRRRHIAWIYGAIAALGLCLGGLIGIGR